MLKRESGGVSWLEFELFQGIEGVSHALFLRHGGVSCPPYGSLNFSSYNGDAVEAVRTNIDKALEIVGAREFVLCELVHGTHIERFDTRAKSRDREADGVSTSLPDLALMTTYADCQCAMIYDPIHHAAANIHAGWRGCIHGIYSNAVRHMVEEYGSNPRDLLVGVGPSLGPDKAEFVNFRREIPEHFHGYRLGEHHFDFWSIARDQFEDAGVLPSHIEIAGLCTYSDGENFFSYRRDKPTGRHAGFIVLR